jgi:hypothetical protein
MGRGNLIFGNQLTAGVSIDSWLEKPQNGIWRCKCKSWQLKFLENLGI